MSWAILHSEIPVLTFSINAAPTYNTKLYPIYLFLYSTLL